MRPVFYDYPDALDRRLRPVDELHAWPEPAHRRTAQARVPGSVRHLPAQGRLVRLLDRAAGRHSRSSPRRRSSTSCRYSSAPAPILPRQPVVQSTAETPARSAQPRCLSRTRLPRRALRRRWNEHRRCRTCDRRSPVARLQAGVTASVRQENRRLSPWWTQIAVTVHGWRSASARLQNGAPASADPVRQTSSFTIPDQGGPAAVTLDTN